jgi:hypothetical protein
MDEDLIQERSGKDTELFVRDFVHSLGAYATFISVFYFGQNYQMTNLFFYSLIRTLKYYTEMNIIKQF